ncbi:MAG: thioredoxin family protein [Planctomycetota bacterium]|nr:thioredoxin family protein [Planctomycetota bacterium]
MAKILTVDDHNFEEALLEQPGRIFVEAWAPSCGPCKAQKNTTERLAREVTANWSFARVNAQKNTDVAARFNIRAVPTILIVVDGEVQQSLLGPHNYDEVVEVLKQHSPNPRRKAS